MGTLERKLSAICVSVANVCADENGFVALRRLLEEFRAKLLIRPLLVEGMLMGPAPTGETSALGGEHWRVLVDSERSRISDHGVDGETSEQPVDVRARFTVAHELVHSLSLRTTEFGIQIAEEKLAGESDKQFADKLEDAAMRLTPLLLVAETALERFCEQHPAGPSISDIDEARRRWGVSPEVFVHRLQLLRTVVDSRALRERKALSDMAVGIAEWSDHNTVFLASNPVFANFDRNVLPEFLIDLLNKRPVNIHEVISDRSFWLNGGPNSESRADVNAGTNATPSVDRMPVVCSVERVERRRGSKFLFLVRTAVRDVSSVEV